MKKLKTYISFLESLKLNDIFTAGERISKEIKPELYNDMKVPRYMIHKVIASLANSTNDPDYTLENWNMIIKELESKCGPFLGELKRSGSFPVFRGTQTKQPTNIKNLYHKITRKDRRPKDTPSDTQKSLDELFYEYFEIEPRKNGVFTTKNYGVASGYSDIHRDGSEIFFPIGEYKYIWSEQVDDLYSALEDIADEFPEELDRFSIGETDIDIFRDLISTYEMDSIELAERQEITFLCDEYYLIDANYLAPLLIHLGLL